MNKEDIKQAAAEYRNDVLCDAALDVNFEENNYDAGYSDCIAEEIPKAFAKGAEWRINSVWHNESEEPNLDDLVIVIRPNGRIFDFGFWGVKDKIREGQLWARMYDLLPKRKEDAE